MLVKGTQGKLSEMYSQECSDIRLGNFVGCSEDLLILKR